MKVLFTPIGFVHFCDDGQKNVNFFENIIPSVIKITNQYKDREDDRTLIIVLSCRTCDYDQHSFYREIEEKSNLKLKFWSKCLQVKTRTEDYLFKSLLETNNAVFVSPFSEIDTCDGKIHCMPNNKPTKTNEEFLELFKDMIDEVLKSS